MQPYLFPYIGYFQLVKLVDLFVLYDDVNFIKQGWINRNKILVSGKDYVFTMPLKEASSFKSIRDTQINSTLFIKWRGKFLRTIEQTYKKAPFFEAAFPLVETILNKDFTSISDYASESIIMISSYIELKTKFMSSYLYYSDTKSFDREDRLIEIIRRNGSDIYINPIGGIELYTKDSFAQKGIQLKFIKSLPIEYKQFDNEFMPWLSIIDVLMFNSVDEVNKMLDQFELI